MCASTIDQSPHGNCQGNPDRKIRKTSTGRLCSVCDLTVSVIEPFDLTNKRMCVFAFQLEVLARNHQLSIIV